jgi:hypothetical protein
MHFPVEDLLRLDTFIQRVREAIDIDVLNIVRT